MDKALFFTKRSLAFSCIFALLINFTVFGSSPAFAAAITVNTGFDAPDDDGGTDTTCGATFVVETETITACTLRAAVQTANEQAGPDTIGFHPSVTAVVLNIAGPGENAAATGDLDLTDTETATIDGGGDVRVIQAETDRVFHVLPGASANLNGLIIQGNKVNQGGGLYNAGVLGVNGSSVVSGTASDGGGIYNADTGSLTLTDSVLAGNNAGLANGEGGGLYNAGPLTSTGTSYRNNVAFTDGGGLYNTGVLATVEGGNFRANEAFGGGGIYNENMFSGGLLLDSVDVGGEGNDGNTATFGGGILNSGFMTITDGAITGNTATQTGGGIHTLVSPDDPCIAGCHLEITNTLVTGNAAVNGNGGGIAASPGLDPNDEAGTVDADGLQLVNNVAGSNGGGFYGSFGNGPGTDVDLVDTSIRNNAAQQDGGGFALTDGEAQIDHTDVIGNEAGVPTETANIPTETADGGGYYLDGSNVTMDGGGDITNNEALLGIGGGIWNRGVLSLRGHNIDSNRAGHGGGIYNGTAGSDGLTITGAAVSANTAEGTVTDGTDVDGPRTNGEGGGIWNDSLLLMESSSINGNTAFRNTTETAMGGEGGGIYNAGGVQNVTTDLSDSDACDETSADGVGVCLSEVDLISNTAQGQPDVEVGANNVGAGKGGGIWNDGSSSDVTAITRLDRATLEENEADLGGGVFSNNAVLYVTGSAFVGNFTENTTSTAGGGAYISGGPGSGDSSSTVTATTFQDNESGFGAGIYYGGGGTNSVDHSLFYSNDANDEGGAFWNDGDLFLENSTVSGNDAGSQGGGLYNEGGEVSSNAVTFNENRAEADDEDAGGNVHDESTRTVRFRMTILADGFPNNCNQDGSDYEDDGYNLADDATCDFGPQNETGSFTSNNAGLDDLRDNGGPTLTHALFRSSPALDAVDPSFCRPPSTDQRYEPRPADGGEEENACDIGAFEHQTEDAFPSTGGDHNGNGGTNNPSPNPSGSPSPQPSASNPAPGGNPAPPPRCAAAARKFGLNLVSGTNGDDELVGTNKGDVICARGGDDEVRGRGGNDIIWLGAGDDHAVGGKGADQIRGGPGHDVVEGSRGGDEIHLGHGRDFAEGNAGNDLLYGHEGNDGLKGGPGGDQLFGGPGIDSCSGGPGTNSKQGCEP